MTAISALIQVGIPTGGQSLVNLQNASLWVGQKSMAPSSIEYLYVDLIMRLVLRAQAINLTAVLLALDVWQRLGVGHLRLLAK